MLKYKILFIKIIILMSGIMCTNMLFAESLVYKNNYKDIETITRMEITRTDVGYLINETRNNKKHIFDTDAFFSILTWKVINPQNNTDITAERKSNRIFVKCRLKNEEIKKTIKINGLLWQQEWSTGFSKFILSDKDTMKF